VGKIQEVATHIDFTLITDKKIKVSKFFTQLSCFTGKSVVLTHSFELTHPSSRRLTFHTSTWGARATFEPCPPSKDARLFFPARLIHPRIPRISKASLRTSSHLVLGFPTDLVL
jgi:hypothetical protein